MHVVHARRQPALHAAYMHAHARAHARAYRRYQTRRTMTASLQGAPATLPAPAGYGMRAKDASKNSRRRGDARMARMARMARTARGHRQGIGTGLPLPAHHIAPRVGLHPHLQRKVLAEGKRGAVRDLEVHAAQRVLTRQCVRPLRPHSKPLSPTAFRPGQHPLHPCLPNPSNAPVLVDDEHHFLPPPPPWTTPTLGPPRTPGLSNFCATRGSKEQDAGHSA